MTLTRRLRFLRVSFDDVRAAAGSGLTNLHGVGKKLFRVGLCF